MFVSPLRTKIFEQSFGGNIMPITLTTPFSLSGSETESDVSGAATSLDIDFQSGVGTIIFRQGNVSGGLLVAGASAPFFVLTVNFNTGAWNVVSSIAPSTIVQSGTFPGAGLTAFINMFVSIRNSAEGFAASSGQGGGFMAGTATAWPNGAIG
jgi:hypothetical protein